MSFSFRIAKRALSLQPLFYSSRNFSFIRNIGSSNEGREIIARLQWSYRLDSSKKSMKAWESLLEDVRSSVNVLAPREIAEILYQIYRSPKATDEQVYRDLIHCLVSNKSAFLELNGVTAHRFLRVVAANHQFLKKDWIISIAENLERRHAHYNLSELQLILDDMCNIYDARLDNLFNSMAETIVKKRKQLDTRLSALMLNSFGKSAHRHVGVIQVLIESIMSNISVCSEPVEFLLLSLRSCANLHFYPGDEFLDTVEHILSPYHLQSIALKHMSWAAEAFCRFDRFEIASYLLQLCLSKPKDSQTYLEICDYLSCLICIEGKLKIISKQNENSLIFADDETTRFDEARAGDTPPSLLHCRALREDINGVLPPYHAGSDFKKLSEISNLAVTSARSFQHPSTAVDRGVDQIPSEQAFEAGSIEVFSERLHRVGYAECYDEHTTQTMPKNLMNFVENAEDKNWPTAELKNQGISMPSDDAAKKFAEISPTTEAEVILACESQGDEIRANSDVITEVYNDEESSSLKAVDLSSSLELLRAQLVKIISGYIFLSVYKIHPPYRALMFELATRVEAFYEASEAFGTGKGVIHQRFAALDIFNDGNPAGRRPVIGDNYWKEASLLLPPQGMANISDKLIQRDLKGAHPEAESYASKEEPTEGASFSGESLNAASQKLSSAQQMFTQDSLPPLGRIFKCFLHAIYYRISALKPRIILLLLEGLYRIEFRKREENMDKIEFEDDILPFDSKRFNSNLLSKASCAAFSQLLFVCVKFTGKSSLEATMSSLSQDFKNEKIYSFAISKAFIRPFMRITIRELSRKYDELKSIEILKCICLMAALDCVSLNEDFTLLLLEKALGICESGDSLPKEALEVFKELLNEILKDDPRSFAIIGRICAPFAEKFLDF